MIWCPACGASEFAELGVLGHLTWLRCRDCGLDVSVQAEEVQP